MQQREAAEIYYEAFQHKLTPILGMPQQAKDILHTSMHTNNAFAAVQEGQLLGLVGFHHEGQHLVDVRFGALVKAFGMIGGSWRAMLGSLLARSPAPGELLMDGIAVHPQARGQGVGTHLFAALFAFAVERAYKRIRLDVVNSNPRARQLYERLGFIAVSTASVPFMKPFGFTTVTTMTLRINTDKAWSHVQNE